MHPLSGAIFLLENKVGLKSETSKSPPYVEKSNKTHLFFFYYWRTWRYTVHRLVQVIIRTRL